MAQEKDRENIIGTRVDKADVGSCRPQLAYAVGFRIARLSFYLGVVFLAGCMTPQQKLAMYGCRYFPAKSGFCCKEKVPEHDRYIFNCKYAEGITTNGVH